MAAAEERYGEAQLKAYRDIGEDALFRFGYFNGNGEPILAGDKGNTERESLSKFGMDVYHRLAVLSPGQGPRDTFVKNPVFAFVSRHFPEIAYGLGSVRAVIEADALQAKGGSRAHIWS